MPRDIERGAVKGAGDSETLNKPDKGHPLDSAPCLFMQSRSPVDSAS